jgi:hypothetical protein
MPSSYDGGNVKKIVGRHCSIELDRSADILNSSQVFVFLSA